MQEKIPTKMLNMFAWNNVNSILEIVSVPIYYLAAFLSTRQ